MGGGYHGSQGTLIWYNPFFTLFGTHIQLLIAMSILAISLAAHLFSNPFVEDGVNLHMMEAMSLSCSIFVFFTGLVFSDPKTSDTGRLIVAIMLLSALIATIVYLMASLLSEISKKLNDLLGNCGIVRKKTTFSSMEILLLFRAILIHLKAKLWQQGSHTYKDAPLSPAVSREYHKMVEMRSPVDTIPFIEFSYNELG